MTPKGRVPAKTVLLPLLLLGVLGGCAEVFQPEKQRAPAPAQQGALPAPIPAPPPEKPAPPAFGEALPTGGDARVFPPEDLIGVSQEEAEVLFGRPGFITQEPPAEVWRYLGPEGCSLTIFFYLDVSNSAYRALTYQVEPEDHDPELCIGSIYQRHARNG